MSTETAASRPLLRYVGRRLATCLCLLAVLSVLVYAGVDVLPGDPVSTRLGLTVSAEDAEQARQRLGLDRPLHARYVDWLTGLLRGDLGTSLLSDRPVSALLSDRVGNSALLAGLTLLILVPLSLVLGVASGLSRARGLDRAVSTGAVLLVALPEYVVAAMLVLVFAVSLRWLPAISLLPAGENPLAHLDLLVLPVLSLLLLSLAYAVRVIRATTAAAARAPHVENARLNGLGRMALLRHAILPAVLPVALQVWCLIGVGLISGAVLVEKVFGYPGIGELLVSSVQAGDLPVAQAMAMLLGGTMLVALLLADLSMVLLTPRLRTRT